MDLGLRDKVAIVTAATANIGRATALELAAEGAGVVVVGRDRASFVTGQVWSIDGGSLL